MRAITEISEIKEASNGNSYVNLTFGMAIEDGVVLPQAVRAIFGPDTMLKQIKAGMKMEVEAI
jgi:hypothetical protein